MFGKIKDRLKGVFDKSEEIIEENPDEEVDNKNLEQEDTKQVESNSKDLETQESTQEEKEEEDDSKKEKKKGFFSKVFSKNKDDEEVEEAESLQEEMLDETPESEKEAIKQHEELSQEEVSKNVDRVNKQEEDEIENSQELEKEIDKEEKTKQDTKTSESSKNIEEDGQGFFSKSFSKLKKKKITQEDFDKIWLDLEIFLLEINVAFEIVENIKNTLSQKLIDNSFDRFQLSKKIREVLVEEVQEVLSKREKDFDEELKNHIEEGEPLKIMMLGVNGTGKTTSIAKIIKYLQNNNYSVVVAAADTFRAAAVDQLKQHCDNLDTKCITHKFKSDPASVAFDAIEHAKSKQKDVVLIDTAGRMPNDSNLMKELQKIKKVSNSQMALFIGDSIAGNDLIEQINLFDQIIGIDGVVLTKVDTDERPGSIVTTSYSIEKPIYFLGTGQNYEDLVKFDSKNISQKLFDEEN